MEVVEEEGVEGEGALVEVGQDEKGAHRVASLGVRAYGQRVRMFGERGRSPHRATAG